MGTVRQVLTIYLWLRVISLSLEILNVRFFHATEEEIDHSCSGDNFGDYEKKKLNFQGKIKKESSIYAYVFRDSEMINLFGWASENF